MSIEISGWSVQKLQLIIVIKYEKQGIGPLAPYWWKKLPLLMLCESIPCLWGQATVCSILTKHGSVPNKRFRKGIINIFLIQFFLPDRRSSTAILTALSKALASAAVWNVRPYFNCPVFQWWKVGITRLYWKSRFIVQLITTYKIIILLPFSIHPCFKDKKPTHAKKYALDGLATCIKSRGNIIIIIIMIIVFELKIFTFWSLIRFP